MIIINYILPVACCYIVFLLTAHCILGFDDDGQQWRRLVKVQGSHFTFSNVVFIKTDLHMKHSEILDYFTRNGNLPRILKGAPNFTTISAKVWNKTNTML